MIVFPRTYSFFTPRTTTVHCNQFLFSLNRNKGINRKVRERNDRVKSLLLLEFLTDMLSHTVALRQHHTRWPDFGNQWMGAAKTVVPSYCLFRSGASQILKLRKTEFGQRRGDKRFLIDFCWALSVSNVEFEFILSRHWKLLQWLLLLQRYQKMGRHDGINTDSPESMGGGWGGFYEGIMWQISGFSSSHIRG